MFLSIYLALLSYYEKPKWRNWQTRTTQTRVPSGVWVRFPPSALIKKDADCVFFDSEIFVNQNSPQVELLQDELDRFLSMEGFVGMMRLGIIA